MLETRVVEEGRHLVGMIDERAAEAGSARGETDNWCPNKTISNALELASPCGHARKRFALDRFRAACWPPITVRPNFVEG
jgi:hypothetical protein